MYVQYDCHRPSTFRVLLWKRSAHQNVLIGHSSEPQVGQSSNTPKGTTRPPRSVVCKICRQSDKYFQRYAPETNCSRTAQRLNIIIFSSATLRIEFRLKIF